MIYHHQLSQERCREITSLIQKYEIDAVLESKDHVYFNTNIKNTFVQKLKKDIQTTVLTFQQVKIQIFLLINLLFGLIIISKNLEIIFHKILISLNVVKKCKSYQRIIPKQQAFKL